MRVLIESTWWSSGPPSGRLLVRELIAAWDETFPADELHVLIAADAVDDFRAEWGDRVTAHGSRAPVQAAAATWSAARVAKRIGADAVVTQNFGCRSKRSVVWVQDVLFMTNPEWFTAKERAYCRLMLPSWRLSTRVLASSDTEAHRIAQFAGHWKPPVPVGLAVAHALLEAEPVEPAGLDAVEGFYLSVGRLNTRKNLRSTLEAAALSSSVTPATPLLVVGAADGRAEELSARANAAIDEGRIRYLGHVSDAELVWLYRGARALLFMSLGEGYGLPPVEAMSFGCPVIASDIPVFRETVGGYATLVPPLDVTAIGAAIDRAGERDPAAPGRTIPGWDEVARRMRAVLVPA